MARWSPARARTSSETVLISKTDSLLSRRGLSRRLGGGILLFLVLFQVGCYSYLPLQTDRPRNPDVRVLLNDRGRAEMSAGLGPLADWVEGTVVNQDSATVRMKVIRVVYIRGGSSVWTGEEVEIPAAGIAGFQARQFSKARSWALFGATLGLVALSILTTSLDFFGPGEPPEPCTRPDCGTNPG
jgi:hypothetical protein